VIITQKRDGDTRFLLKNPSREKTKGEEKNPLNQAIYKNYKDYLEYLRIRVDYESIEKVLVLGPGRGSLSSHWRQWSIYTELLVVNESGL